MRRLPHLNYRLCALSNRIVGYSVSDRMESKIAVDALNRLFTIRGVVGV